jgi:lipase chaperone LimK
MKPTSAIQNLGIFAVFALGAGLAVYAVLPEDNGDPQPAAALPATSTPAKGNPPEVRFVFGPGQMRSSDAAATPSQCGLFAQDLQGRPVFDAKVPAAFDAVLATYSPQPSAAELEVLTSAVRKCLSGRDADAAAALFRQYAALRKAQSDLESDPTGAAALSPMAWVDKLRQLRRHHLGPELADKLFGEEEKIAVNELERARLISDPSLTGAQRSEKLRALGAPQSAADEATALAASLQQQVEALRRGGAPESEIQALRERRLGASGAAATAEMEHQKTKWEQRYLVFAQRKAAIQQSAASQDDKRKSIEMLLREQYAESEIATVEAYDLQQTRQANAGL